MEQGEHSDRRWLGCYGFPAVISVTAIKYPEKKELRGETLFQLFFFFSETGFLCVALAFLELTL